MVKKRTYRVAVAQLGVEAEDQRVNACGILEAIDLAAEEGAEFLVTPEMCLTGYHGRFDQRVRDEMVGEIRAAAKAGGVTVILGAGDRRGGVTYNEQLVIDGSGGVLGRHAKMVPTSGDLKWCVAGKRLRVFHDRGLTFGCLICNDLWVTPGTGAKVDPRLTLQLSRRGAKAVFHSVNSGAGMQYVPFHESNLSLRAREGKLYIAVANAAVKGRSVNASSGIVTPDGEWVIRCPRRGRQFAVADIEVG